MKSNKHSLAPYAKAIATGAFSAGIFLIIFGFGAGVPLMLLPSLPLFWIGLSRPPIMVCLAGITGIVLALLTTGIESAIFYAGFIAVPVLLFAPAAIAPHPKGGHIRPIGDLLTDLAIYAALAYTALIAWYEPQGGLQKHIADFMREGFANADHDTQETAGELGGQLAFLIMAASAWWWVLLMYAHAVIANGLLGLNVHKLRASLALAPFALPAWLLAALAATAAFSLLGDGVWAFGAQVIILILLLPYFLLGLTIIHEKIRRFPGRIMLFFLLYFFIFVLLWPALIIAAMGVWKQCRALIHPAR